MIQNIALREILQTESGNIYCACAGYKTPEGVQIMERSNSL